MRFQLVICCASLLLTGDASTINDIVTTVNTKKVFTSKGNPSCDLKTDGIRWLNHNVTKLRLSGPASVEVLQVKSDAKHTRGLLRLKVIKVECAITTDFWLEERTNIVNARIGSMDIEVKISTDSPRAPPKILVINVEDVTISEVPLILSGVLSQAEDSLNESGPMIQESIEAIVNAALGAKKSPHCL
ncbi:uncharacterized protein LOC144104908 [Amblyomma americanum]